MPQDGKITNIQKLHLMVLENKALTLNDICMNIYGENNHHIQINAHALICTYRKKLYDTQGLSFYFDREIGAYTVLHYAASFRRVYNTMNAAMMGTKRAIERVSEGYQKSIAEAQPEKQVELDLRYGN